MSQERLQSIDSPGAPAAPFPVLLRGRTPLALAPASGSKPHLMQVVLSLAPGGTERLVIEIARRIAGRFDVTVCCLDDEGAWAPELRDAGIEVIALKRASGFRPGVGAQIARLARTRGVDLLHCHQYSPFVYGRIAKLLHPRLGLIYTEHGRLSDAPPSWKRQLVNPLLSQFDGAIVAVSDDLRQYMHRSRFPRARVGVVRNGIDPAPLPGPADRLAARARLGIGEDQFVIASVARLDPVKDLPSMLDAYASARPSLPPSQLLLIGDGPERAALEERAARPDLAGAVQFLGMRADVRALLCAADLYVNSSISEGISITILEAMAAGVPVVATSAGGTPEVLADGLAGVLVPARNPERLAQALIALAKDPATRRQLAVRGRQRLATSFTAQRMVAEYVQLYHRFLD